MKNILLVSFVMLTAQIAFGQKSVSNDPSYSVHNYKHPNKAAYAKKHKTDKSTVLTGTAKRNDNYKQSFKKSAATDKAVVRTNTGRDKSNKSYKHPYGL